MCSPVASVHIQAVSVDSHLAASSGWGRYCVRPGQLRPAQAVCVKCPHIVVVPAASRQPRVSALKTKCTECIRRAAEAVRVSRSYIVAVPAASRQLRM